MHCNIRGLRTNRCQLCAFIEMHTPSIVCLNETFLDEAVVHPEIPNYVLKLRRDRGSDKGGIAVYVERNIADSVCELAKSRVAERGWLLVHSHSGPLLLCCFYRPPHRGETSSIASLESEYIELRDQAQ